MWFLAQIIFRPCWQKVMEFKLIRQTFSNNLQTNSTKWTQKWMWAYISAMVWCIETKLVVYNKQTWGYLQYFGIVPPSGQEIWKMAIFAYNFWMVWPKIIKLVSLDSVEHAELNHSQFSHVSHFGRCHFELCCKILYFTNALTYRYETRYVSSAPCPDGTQKGWGQCHLVVKSYNEISKNTNNFCLH